MSRMTTSRASFSWARPAMRRACSSVVSLFGLPLGSAASLAGRPGGSVEASALDRRGDRRRGGPVDRLAARDALPDLARRDRHGPDLEEEHALWTRQLREHGIEALPRVAGPSCNPQAGEVEHAVGVLPAEEVGELVGADEEDRLGEVARAQ